MRRHDLFAAAFLIAMSLAASPAAATVSVTVPGTANPFLAGQPPGSSCCGNDVAPDNAPLEIALPAGTRWVVFSNVQGGVSNDPILTSYPLYGPNGNAGWLETDSALNGLGGFQNGPINALVGVFLGVGPANGSGQADFSQPTDMPGLANIFFIGDGQLGSGAPVSFRAPAGATRLYLGVIDGFDWRNNVGSFSLDVTASAAPELTTWAMMALGFAGVGAFARLRRGSS